VAKCGAPCSARVFPAVVPRTVRFPERIHTHELNKSIKCSMKPTVVLTLAARALAYGEGNAAVRLAPPPSTATLSWAAGSEVAPCAVRWPGAARVRLDVLLPAGASELAAETV
jgi:hypothetical protein